jgi:hypothetical protein
MLDKEGVHMTAFILVCYMCTISASESKWRLKKLGIPRVLTEEWKKRFWNHGLILDSNTA